jgi:putative tryptophan/tyrosine transport system substrate-binding protein
MPKRLQLLKQLVPRAVRVAVLVDPNTQFGVMAMPDNQLAASKLGLRLETFEVRSSTDLDAAFARIRDSRSDAVALIPEPLLFVQRA